MWCMGGPGRGPLVGLIMGLYYWGILGRGLVSLKNLGPTLIHIGLLAGLIVGLHRL